MGRYIRELVDVGVMLGGEGLHPSTRGRVSCSGGQVALSSTGPFADTHSLVAGFWMWEVRDIDEVKRSPNPMPGPSEIEIRLIFDAEGFGEAPTPELAEGEERLAVGCQK